MVDMRIRGRLGLIGASVLALCATAVEANAGIIIGNIPPTYTTPTYNTNGSVTTGLGIDYAVEFQASATETVDTAKVVVTIAFGTTPTLGIYNATSGNAIGTLVASFTDPGLTFGTAVTETFTGSAPLTNGQKYFLVLDGNNSIVWFTSFSFTTPNGLVPIGSGATYLATGGLGSYAADNLKPSFELDGTTAALTPEPSTLILACLGGLIGLCIARHRRAV
jgi:hypothetical protein